MFASVLEQITRNVFVWFPHTKKSQAESIFNQPTKDSQAVNEIEVQLFHKLQTFFNGKSVMSSYHTCCMRRRVCRVKRQYLWWLRSITLTCVVCLGCFPHDLLNRSNRYNRVDPSCYVHLNLKMGQFDLQLNKSRITVSLTGALYVCYI